MSSNQNSALEELINRFSQSIPDPKNQNQSTLKPVLDNIGALAKAAENNHRPGFHDICNWVHETFSDIVGTKETLNDNQYELLKQWRILAFNYVKDSKKSTADALLDFFKHKDLDTSIKDEDLSTLEEYLEKECHTFPIMFTDIITDLENDRPIQLSRLIDKLESFIQTSNEDDLAGFIDICLLFQENISDIDHIKHELNSKQKGLTLNWLKQAELYLSDKENTKAASSLITILRHDEWPTSLEEVDADILLEMFDSESSDEPSDIIPAELNELLENFQNSILQDTQFNKEKVHEVADKTEEIGLAAGEHDLLGFQDICLIVKENLSDIVEDESTDPQTLGDLIHQWSPLIKNYLSTPSNAEAIQNILDFLTDNRWPNPASAEDIGVLKDMFVISDDAPDPMDSTMVASPDQMDSTMVASPDQMDSTIVTSNEQVQEMLNEILEGVIDTNDILAASHTVSKDLVEMLKEEMITLRDEVKNHIDLIGKETTEKNIISDSLSQYALRIERFGSACQAAELDGLYQASSVFSKNLEYLAKNENRISPHQISLLAQWPDINIAYLKDPVESDHGNKLVEILQDESLPNAQIKEVAPALINLLKAINVSEQDVNKEARKTEATAEDISIDLPPDINQELLDGLLMELPGQTEQFSAAVQAFIDGSGDISEVQKAQRIAHTVKGAANTVGVKGIAILTHQLEDIFSALSELNHLPSPALASVFMEASDCLEEMSEALLERGSAPAHSQVVLQSVLDWANRIEAEGTACLTSEEEDMAAAPPREKPKEDQEQPVDDSAAATLRVPAKLIDDVLRLLGESMIVTSQLQERVRISSEQSQRLIEHQNMVQNLTSDLEVQVDINSSAYGHKQAVNQNEVFDSLELEEYNELHTVTHQIVEAAVDSFELNQEISSDLRDLDELIIEKTRLHNEIQELVMRTRMIPIKTIVPRLQRIVRQTCRTTKKQAALEIAGSETLIDSDILNKLIDPLMHMLRNAVDHGIESREDRISSNKNPEGKLHLSFLREGTQIVVKCKDDGAGLDRKMILETAINRGLVQPDDDLSESDINRLILHPGFSTREKATQTSGRGVGMDIVHTEILAMKGSVHVESERKQGCLVELRMPITLMSSHALLLRNLNQIIAVSNHGIEKILHPSDSQIIETDDGLVCEVDGERLTMLTLESLLNLPSDRRANDRITRPALLIREEELNHVIYIQEIVDTRDLFIKSIGKYLNNIRGMLGATILGDGSVVPVIDLPELIRKPVTNVEHMGDITQTNMQRALPVALVVDDSLSARRALAQVIKDAGFDVRTAKDGLEAVGIIEKKKPDIMLVDMEMPRMNGMELTSHIRGLEDRKDIPVIMVTSRSTDKHRKQAEEAGVDVYVTKPFTEDDLLDHVHSLLN